MTKEIKKEIIHKALMVRDTTHERTLKKKPYGWTVDEFINNLLDVLEKTK